MHHKSATRENTKYSNTIYKGAGQSKKSELINKLRNKQRSMAWTVEMGPCSSKCKTLQKCFLCKAVFFYLSTLCATVLPATSTAVLFVVTGHIFYASPGPIMITKINLWSE